MGRFSPICALAAVGILCLMLVSCGKQQPEGLRHVLPQTSQATISFDERQIADDCLVFAQLIVVVPEGLSGQALRKEIVNFATANGADFIFIGLARTTEPSEETVVFHPYGPKTPYLFKKRWNGWKFGFADWNKGGSLLDFSSSHLDSSDVVFGVPAVTQAVLLSCPSLEQPR